MNTPRPMHTVQMYGHRRTGFWIVVQCPNGHTLPPSMPYGAYTLDAIGTPSELLSEVNRWLECRGVYRPLRALGRIVNKSPRQVGRYLSGEVQPDPGPGWENVVKIAMALSWDDRWKIWKRLSQYPSVSAERPQ